MIQLAAWSYVAIVAGVIVFQFCLIGGAPWGRLTQGGRYPQALPAAGRITAALSVPLLAGMAGAVASAAGMAPGWPVWTAWTALALQALSTILNWITPSRAERMLWSPVTTLMLLLAVCVIVGGRQPGG